MRWFKLLPVVLVLSASALGGEAATGRIIKVLPHLLDRDGRHTLSPSLYERDAYQAFLRKNPEQCSGLRFDVHWKAKRVAGTRLLLRVDGDSYRKVGEVIAWRATLWEGDRLVAEQKSFLW